MFTLFYTRSYFNQWLHCNFFKWLYDETVPLHLKVLLTYLPLLLYPLPLHWSFVCVSPSPFPSFEDFLHTAGALISASLENLLGGIGSILSSWCVLWHLSCMRSICRRQHRDVNNGGELKTILLRSNLPQCQLFFTLRSKVHWHVIFGMVIILKWHSLWNSECFSSYGPDKHDIWCGVKLTEVHITTRYKRSKSTVLWTPVPIKILRICF